MNFVAFFCLHYIPLLYCLIWSEDADQTFLSNLGPSLYRCQLILFSKRMYSVDPDKDPEAGGALSYACLSYQTINKLLYYQQSVLFLWRLWMISAFKASTRTGRTVDNIFTLIFIVKILSTVRPVLVEALKALIISFLYAQYTGTQETYICLMSCKRIKRMNYYMERKLQQT